MNLTGISAWMNAAPEGAEIVLPFTRTGSNAPGQLVSIAHRKGLEIRTEKNILLSHTHGGDDIQSQYGMRVRLVSRANFIPPKPRGRKRKK